MFTIPFFNYHTIFNDFNWTIYLEPYFSNRKLNIVFANTYLRSDFSNNA